jgi:ABC-type branched-subunit amino acid transport system substrate-binding protein
MRKMLLLYSAAILLLAYGVIWLTAKLEQNLYKLAEQRLKYAKKNQGDIVIVAIEEPGKTAYINGIRLAVQKVNERPGKLIGRPLELMIEKGGHGFKEDQSTMRQIAANPQVTAVLGHESSMVMTAAVIYETSQVILLPPFYAARALTEHNFKFVFSMVPNSQIMSKQLASIAQLLGYKKMALLYSRDDYSRELAFLFEDAALSKHITFVHRSSFSIREKDYRNLIAQLREKEFNAVFVSTWTEPGALMIKQLREMDINVPIIGADTLNSRPFEKAAGLAGENTITPTIYDIDAQTNINQEFSIQYQQVYNIKPDYNAAQGYDSVMLLAYAIEQTQSTLPKSLSATLHYIPYWIGVTGVHAFDSVGNIFGKKYFFQVLKNNQWHMLPAINIPYLLESFEHLVALQTRQKEEWDLRLMSVAATKDLLDVGRNLIIVALVGADLHIRIFDASGKKVIDKAESELISGEILTALKKRLNPFPDESSLSKEDKQEIIQNATSIAGHTQKEITPYSELFATRLHPDDNKKLQLDLLHEIFRFRRLGLIYEDTPDGKKLSGYDLVQAVARKKGFTVIDCDLPFSRLQTKEAESRLLRCYGKLAPLIDALYVSPYPGINQQFITQLNETLRYFKVPVLAILEEKPKNTGITMALGKPNMNLQALGLVNVFDKLLSGLRVYEFAEKLNNLPVIAVNLKVLNEYGYLSSDDRILKLLLILSPHMYIE